MEALVGTVMGAIIGTILGLIILTLLGFILKALWNSTLPELFGFKTITTWQAIKLLFIASLIFGGNRVISPAPSSTQATQTQAEGKAG